MPKGNGKRKPQGKPTAGTITVACHFRKTKPKAKWESIEQIGSHLCFLGLLNKKNRTSKSTAIFIFLKE
jgi:hypothetical protein